MYTASTPFPTHQEIEDAAHNFPTELVVDTPLLLHHRLSQRIGASVFVKNEGLQSVGSYKIRGASNAIRLRTDSQFTAASAGNHSQGVSLACRHYQKKAVIYMPKTTPPQKIAATKNRGGEWVDVRLFGDDFDSAYHEARKYSLETGSNFIHPFDDADVIAGQGTVALEIMRQMHALGQSLDYIFVPVGGGGLLAGTLCYIRQYSPKTVIIGVEPNHAACMRHSISAGQPITLEKMSTFVDGAAVRTPGRLTFEIVRTLNARLMTVPEDRVCATMLRLFHFDKIITEPAGALAIDALESCKDHIQGKNVVCVISGSNFDASRYPEVIRRKERFKKRRRYFTVKIPNRPDALSDLLSLMKGKNVNIRHFHFEEESPGGIVEVLLGIESDSQESLSLTIDILSDTHDVCEETHNPLLKSLIER